MVLNLMPVVVVMVVVMVAVVVVVVVVATIGQWIGYELPQADN